MQRLVHASAHALVALMLASALGACAEPPPEAPDVDVELAVDPQPPRQGPANVTVWLRDAAGEPLSGARLQIEGNMNHAGMRPSFATPEEVAPGRYQATLDFTMAGDWFLLVGATLADGRQMQRRIDVRGVAPR